MKSSPWNYITYTTYDKEFVLFIMTYMFFHVRSSVFWYPLWFLMFGTSYSELFVGGLMSFSVSYFILYSGVLRQYQQHRAYLINAGTAYALQASRFIPIFCAVLVAVFLGFCLFINMFVCVRSVSSEPKYKGESSHRNNWKADRFWNKIFIQRFFLFLLLFLFLFCFVLFFALFCCFFCLFCFCFWLFLFLICICNDIIILKRKPSEC